ncbi:hypothetical protein LIER_35517 [Lithospermum erythrorhizon]|uniref:DUF4283 domain-containing protein n=1 Tax=Lithospermum erythrorhizon TaxID=34254 RepID=A0AAV3NT48_LITER
MDQGMFLYYCLHIIRVQDPKVNVLCLHINIKNVSLAMSNAWNCWDLRVSRAGGSILHVFFPSLEEKKRVMRGGSWCFDNQLLIFRNWVRGADPTNLVYNSCIFWIRVQGLNDEFYTKDVAEKSWVEFNLEDSDSFPRADNVKDGLSPSVPPEFKPMSWQYTPILVEAEKDVEVSKSKGFPSTSPHLKAIKARNKKCPQPYEKGGPRVSPNNKPSISVSDSDGSKVVYDSAEAVEQPSRSK